MTLPAIVADGAKRNRAAVEHHARSRVEPRYVSLMGRATWVGRIVIRRRIERRIRTIMSRRAPSVYSLHAVCRRGECNEP